MIKRIQSSIALIGLVLAASWAQQAVPTTSVLPTVSFVGEIRDTALRGDSLDVVLLETGDSRRVLWGESFQFQLPLDSVWNLCALSAKSERCYLIRRTDSSLRISGVLLDDRNSVIYSESYLDELENKYSEKAPSSYSKSDSLLLASAAQVGTEDNASSAVEEGSTKLRKVVMNIKKRPKRSLGQSTVSAKNIKRMPSLAEADVVKAIQALPGVVASSDFSSKIYVRGGGADQNLFLFDKAPVFSPVHFFGLFSTFLVEGVDKVDFYKGGFSPQFGNRLSSVVDVQSRRGGLADSLSSDTLWKWNPKEIGQEALAMTSAILRPVIFYDICDSWKCYDRPKDQFGGSFLISTFASTLHLQGQNGPVRFQVAGRATYLKEMLGLMREAGITDLDIDYRFYDLQGAVDVDGQDGSSWKLSFYQGQDKLVFTPINLSWGNFALPLNYRKKQENGSEYGATLSYSNFNQLFDLENIQAFENSIDNWMLKPWMLNKIDDNNSIYWGSELQVNNAIFVQDVKILSNPTDSTKNASRFEDGGYFNIISPFAEWKHQTENNWDYSLGLRTNFETPLNDLSFEPRFSASWRFAPDQKLDFHIGRYFQYINSILFSNFESINEFYYPSVKTKYNKILPSNSILLSTGWSNARLFEGWDCSAEAFYKTLDNLISFQPGEASADIQNDPEVKLGDFLRTAEGYSYGLELSLRKNAGKMTGGLSYSYGKSVLNEAGQIFPANWDKTHSVKFDAAVNWFGEDGLWEYSRPRPGRYFRSSFGFSWTSGLPTTSVLGYMPQNVVDQGSGEAPGGPSPFFTENISIPSSSRNQDRYPPYFRFDVKAVDWGVEDEWNLSWSIINLTNHENVFLYNYNKTVSPPKRQSVTQFPFLPVMISFQRYF